MPRKDHTITPSVTQKLQLLDYNIADWDDSQTSTKLTPEIRNILSRASKSGNNKPGYPDRIYVNKQEKLLILVEEKPAAKDHDHSDPKKGAVSGIKWYLSQFVNKSLTNWKILGIAVSGDLSLEYQHKFNCYTIDQVKKQIVPLPIVTNFLVEDQFLSLFNTLDEERAVSDISASSKKINNLLRSIDSQKRPVLLSALMICLHKVAKNDENYLNDFADYYQNYAPSTITTSILATVKQILKIEGVPTEKLEVLDTELAFLKTDQNLNGSEILKEILNELKTAVIPLFNSSFVTNSNYDIIGKFYEEFLKYAGVSNVKKGIVLTPRHITTLFTELIDLKDNDKIVDLCCGTGAFLIAGMNALVNKITESTRSDKQSAIAKVKNQQLLGFETNSTMYICAISNMLFRGDGKSSIYNYDSIHSPKAQEILDNFKPTIGFINPPYGGKETKEDPTPKEITFLAKLLNNCSRYGVVIAPLSVFLQDDIVRDNLLSKHTLKYVINMPSDLFQPNASTHTAIAVFETNKSFNYGQDEVIFYDLLDDGFVLSKNKGRTDIYNRWHKIKSDMLKKLKSSSHPDGYTMVKARIKPKDEWLIYSHSKVDYSSLNEDDFIKPIADYMIHKAKVSLGLVNTKASEMQKIEAIGNYYSGNHGIKIETTNRKLGKNINISTWKLFELYKPFKQGLFEMSAGKYISATSYGEGETPLISASETDNGIMALADLEPKYPRNCLTIGKVGMSTFYQETPFLATSDVTVLTPLYSKFNQFIAMFFIGVLSKQKYQWNYGNQIRLNDSQKLKLILPVNKNGTPDYEYMEKFIKSLPYADL